MKIYNFIKKYWWLIVILGLFVDYQEIRLKWPWLSDKWIDIITTLVTVWGLMWTIDEQRKQFREDKRLSSAPYFQYTVDVGIYPYRLWQKDVQNKKVLDYELNRVVKPQSEFIIPLNVENIGFGNAFIDEIRVVRQGVPYVFPKEGECKKFKTIKMNDANVFYISYQDKKPSDVRDNLKIEIYFNDLLGYRYKDTLLVSGFKSDYGVDKLEESYKSYMKSRDKIYAQEDWESVQQSIFSGNIYIWSSIHRENAIPELVNP